MFYENLKNVWNYSLCKKILKELKCVSCPWFKMSRVDSAYFFFLYLLLLGRMLI